MTLQRSQEMRKENILDRGLECAKVLEHGLFEEQKESQVFLGFGSVVKKVEAVDVARN